MAIRPKLKKQLLCVADSFLSIFVIAPLVVAFWRGLWQLMDQYLFNNNIEASVWASTAIGVGLGVFLDVFQDCFKKTISYKKTPKLYLLVSRFYTVVYGFTNVNHWRGIWIGWDLYTGSSWESGAISMFLGLFLLIILRGVKNLIAPPFTVMPDHYKEYFTIPNLYGTNKSNGIYFYMDVFSSVVVITSLVVFVWRGMWILLDRMLYPDSDLYSGIGSAVIGITVTIVIFVAEPILQRMKIFKSKGIMKIVVEDIYFTMCLIGTLNVWRSVWVLLNVLLYPDRPLLSNILSTVVGIACLIIMQNGNSSLVRGTHMDGKKQGPKAITVAIEYLRFFFKDSEIELQEKENTLTDVENRTITEESKLKCNGIIEAQEFIDEKDLPQINQDTK